ncbi:MHYT domain-containing protein [Embleya sp. NPDC001921]
MIETLTRWESEPLSVTATTTRASKPSLGLGAERDVVDRARFDRMGGMAGMAGMAAISMAGDVGYNPWLVVLLIVIAVVPATTALWFALTVKGPVAIAGVSLLTEVASAGCTTPTCSR